MRMQQQLGDTVTVLAVSTDQSESAYQQFLADRHIHLLTVRDPSGASNGRYGTKQFPESFIIDKRGVVRRKFIGPVDWTKPEIEHDLRQLAQQ